MATKNYTTKTASLKATTADIRKLDATSVNAKSMTLDGVDVKQAIEEAKSAADNAAIQVGRDADKDWNVDTTAIDMVKKISFLGDYVNVVEGENGEVKLYIGQNKSLPEMASGNLSGTPSNTTSINVYK